MIDESSITPEIREAAMRLVDQGNHNFHDAYAAAGAKVIKGDARIEAILNPEAVARPEERFIGRVGVGGRREEPKSRGFSGLTRGESESEVTPAGHEPFVDPTEAEKEAGKAGVADAKEALRRATEK